MTDPITPIRADADHLRALAEIRRLIDSAPGTPEADRLEVLGVLVADYERRTQAAKPADPIDILTFSMTAQGRNQSDLASLLGSRSRASEVLHRRRALSADMVARISRAWSIPAELLSAPYRIRAGVGRLAARAAAVVGVLGLVAAGAFGAALWQYGRDLPTTAQLATYVPPDMARFNAEGQFERRHFVPLADIPPHVVKAILAAEDSGFYDHGGYSVAAMLRAIVQNIAGLIDGQRLAGAATITQQVAKNLLLPGQAPSLARKTKEVLLARRIEQSLSKERVLEIYLSQIYFGGGAWGVAAAAQHYFGKTLADLSVAEAAYLASLPKAPNHYRLDVAANRARATARRDWVLGRMAQDGFITVSAAKLARDEPLGGINRRTN
jgi:penicillin-binding protein 1A